MDLVHELRGMYAFAIWDGKKQGLFIARDPFGIKPLYFMDDGKTFWCASQVKALKMAQKNKVEISSAGLIGFYLWGNIPEPHTLYENIWSLPAGHTLWVDREGVRKYQQYFSVYDELPVAALDFSQKVLSKSLLSDMLRDTVKHHMVSDVPVGVFLSAGLDSTVLAALASEISPNINAITLGFHEFLGTAQDEVPLAKLVAKNYGFEHSVDTVRYQDSENELSSILHAMDQPSIDGVNTYFVARAAARAGLKVVLSGLGGDELFGSYPSFQQISKLVRMTRPISWLPGFGKAFRVVTSPVIQRFTSPKYGGIFEYGSTYGGAYLLRRGLFMPWELFDFLDPDMVKEGWERLQPVLRLDDSVAGISAEHAKISALEMSVYMRNMLLRDADWAGMAHSLEIRVPFVDIELFRSLAPFIATNSMPEKSMMAFAPTIRLPKEITNKPKTGFSVPVGEWVSVKLNSQKRELDQIGLRDWAIYLTSMLFR